MVRLLRENGAARGRTLFTPTTFQIDLTKSEDELLRSFNSKTRYNIRLAERKGVTVEEDNSDKAFDKYLDLMKRTVEHQRFYAHDTKYHKLMWESLNLKIKNTNSKVARLLVAKHNKKIITTWILFVWKDTLYYPYGARDERYNSLMANNLMMWETIKYGKNLKLKTFDLWGREPGKGFTKFKEGYNPEVIETLGTWDLVINKPLYYLYRGADMGRWMVLRGKSRFVVPRF
jgi:lipid II:glycine glycyltransferase (peptidoglycan interpeptide bridge formation enzyme)